MTRRHSIDGDLEPQLAAPERDDARFAADRLWDERPAPREDFYGALARKLTRSAGPPPGGLRLSIGVCGASGIALLAIAALGAAGVGPMAF